MVVYGVTVYRKTHNQMGSINWWGRISDVDIAGHVTTDVLQRILLPNVHKFLNKFGHLNNALSICIYIYVLKKLYEYS